MHALIQLRGPVNVDAEVRDTLEMLNLGSVNQCTFVPETDSYRGMITKVTDLVAFGTPSPDTIALLLRQRGEPVGGEPGLTDEWVAEHTDYEDIDAVAEALHAEDTTLSDLGLKPVLRLHPARGGHEGIKHHRADGGQLGRHTTEEIDELLYQMR